MTSHAGIQLDQKDRREPLEAASGFFVAPAFQTALADLGLDSLDAVFASDRGKDLAKRNIGRHRRRSQIEATLPGCDQPVQLFLKRYQQPPRLQQIANWLVHRRRVSLGRVEHDTGAHLAAQGIGTPHTVACGEQWGPMFEMRSFLMTREVAQSESLERKLPDCFAGPATRARLRRRRDFIKRLAVFVKRFHETGYRHRDLYLSHIFYSTSDSFCLIDLARAFKPIQSKRFQIKDLAQLHYSAPRQHFSATDRLRFYRAYCGRSALEPPDRSFIAAVVRKAMRMARHNRKHRVPVPFLDRTNETDRMSKRVAIIMERADIALGGAERSMSEVAAALSDGGWQVDLLAAKGGCRADNVHVLCCDVRGKRVGLDVFAKALKHHLARTRYDILHSVLPFDFADVYQPRGGTYAEALRQNAASYPHRMQRWCKKVTAFTNTRRTQLLRAERSLCRRADGPVIAALSNYVVEQLTAHYGADPQRIVLTLNGVATDREADPQAAERLRSEIFDALRLGKATDPVLLLFAAHNFRLKGLDRLIRALPLALATSTERPPYLIVLGAGNTGPYRRLAERLGVDKHIAFPGPAQNVQDALSISHIGVLPTFYDPSSRFILEALAAGKPVITTRFNGAADHFVDGRHGIVVDSPENTPALARAITHFTTTANVTKAAKAIAEDNLKDRVSIDRVARDLRRLYESILERRRSP